MNFNFVNLYIEIIKVNTIFIKRGGTMGKIINLSGQTFKWLTVLNKDPNPPKYNNTYWIYKCHCNVIISASTYDLRKGIKTSCGCMTSELRKKASTKHGDFGTKFYNVWDSMKSRCLNKNHKFYLDYGGRGILVHNNWLDYQNFKNDMYQLYLEHKQNNTSTQLDRINNNGNYELSNCKWSTRKEQNNNKRIDKDMKLFEATYTILGPSFGYKEQSYNQSEFSEKYRLYQQTIGQCLKGRFRKHKGWTFRYV